MKLTRAILLLTAIISVACKKEQDATIHDKGLVAETKAPERQDTIKKVYEKSTFRDPKGCDRPGDVCTGLRELCTANVFTSVYQAQMQKLSKVHFKALKKRVEKYMPLYVADGSLFSPTSKDKVIVVYEPEMNRLAILLYNDIEKSMGELYNDYKVENGLKSADCHYSAFGTLDYQLAAELVSQKEHLITNPESLFENPPCLIGDFSRSPDYAPEGSCSSSNMPKAPTNVLCIATSFVYNNWECLKYNKDTKSFTLFYGQAFAD